MILYDFSALPFCNNSFCTFYSANSNKSTVPRLAR